MDLKAVAGIALSAMLPQHDERPHTVPLRRPDSRNGVDLPRAVVPDGQALLGSIVLLRGRRTSHSCSVT